MRAVLDPNVLIAALISRIDAAPAQVVSRWLAGEFELVVSETLLAELQRALAYPKVRSRVMEDEAETFMALLRRGARLTEDPKVPAPRSLDPGDDYLLALAESERAVVVTSDRHLLALSDAFPVHTPRAFLKGM